MLTLWLLAGAVGTGTLLALTTTVRRRFNEVYDAGFNQALAQVLVLVRQRAEIAVELAPRGSLPSAMIRVQMADSIERDLKQLKDRAHDLP